jgi:predicted amidohydrolase YtcJ
VLTGGEETVEAVEVKGDAVLLVGEVESVDDAVPTATDIPTFPRD